MCILSAEALDCPSVRSVLCDLRSTAGSALGSGEVSGTVSICLKEEAILTTIYCNIMQIIFFFLSNVVSPAGHCL